MDMAMDGVDLCVDGHIWPHMVTYGHTYYMKLWLRSVDFGPRR